jgi:hypothetical protein
MLGWEKPRCSVDVPLNQSLIGAFPSILLIFVSWADVSHGLLDFDESEGRKSDHLLQKNVAMEWCSPNDQQLVGGLEHDFFHILGIRIPTDELIFFRGVQTTNQTRLLGFSRKSSRTMLAFCLGTYVRAHSVTEPPSEDEDEESLPASYMGVSENEVFDGFSPPCHGNVFMRNNDDKPWKEGDFYVQTKLDSIYLHRL